MPGSVTPASSTSTTIEEEGSLSRLARKALKVTIAVLALFLASQAILMAVFLLRGEAGTVLAVVPQGFTADRLPVNASIIAWDGPWATLVVPASGGPALYRSGVLLVLPVRRNGCLALAEDSI